ncbi:hypothetical protein PHYSODRAFT_304445 [Phytophthora sojae]|uniref:Uncharacterized protein n=1 Tax=Phytophthora sojae (strain P6497) TaxID=1094619 RepID=G5A0Z6_PHYSP|nr:hypothetical protein PHYSODRAFT_304445 [Phytophthora sojae]EGZ10628.1 hypothetical protein PHYSODRAFT_304445 [Phytophthora sojae]|eukprot:XP_009533373.1 hypothetical protein PHYSODRAFT_304445 [Phytophthora sojae]
MTAAEKKKVRRIRRTNEPAPPRSPSITNREELRKRASLWSTGEASSTQTAEKDSAALVAMKDTALGGATAAGKMKQKKPMTATGDVERIGHPTLTDMTCNMQLLADLGSSDEEDESESMMRATSGASCTGPPTSMPTSRAVAAALPTSSPTTSAGPPTSVDAPTTPSRGRPRERALPTSAGKRKRKRTSNTESSKSEQEYNADVVRAQVAGEKENVLALKNRGGPHLFFSKTLKMPSYPLKPPVNRAVIAPLNREMLSVFCNEATSPLLMRTQVQGRKLRLRFQQLNSPDRNVVEASFFNAIQARHDL